MNPIFPKVCYKTPDLPPVVPLWVFHLPLEFTYEGRQEVPEHIRQH